ncbi:MAG TPA: hypothetical protein VE869_01320 [Gemmatimonas sp.]|nr:hypothetical protein [Gemmatimonas sp.]
MIASTGACASTGAAPSVSQAPLTSNACFPVERLAATERATAERILLEIADGEGLYTLAGGIKPISSDVRDMAVRIAPTLDTAALARLEALRQVAAVLTCGDVGAFVQVYTAPSPMRDGSSARQAALVVYHGAALRAAVTRQAAFFGALGVTPSADAREIVAAVENAPRAERWRGYGYLFGYPDEAVDFFVRAGVEGDSTRTLVPRDFRRVETFRKLPERAGAPATLSTLVYAVPKGAAESAGDRALRERAAPHYARYVSERARHVRGDSTGAIALWRAWLMR